MNPQLTNIVSVSLRQLFVIFVENLLICGFFSDFYHHTLNLSDTNISTLYPFLSYFLQVFLILPPITP